ncbi:hypothetical protein [Bacillus massiliglaciei]|uniref:hypothetical protein n=1 Tax=Bacillus massiliglaciei TaxID=1816693 RepID=UPI000DA62B32|nr:hypothetical protein [Bacillus massiliglaciei]
MVNKEDQALETFLAPHLFQSLQNLSAETKTSIKELLEMSVVLLIDKMSRESSEQGNINLNNQETIIKNKLIINKNRAMLNND